MVYFGFILLILGLLCLPISIVVFVIKKILKKTLKGTKRVMVSSLISIVVGFVIFIIFPMPEENADESNTKETEYHANNENNQDEAKQISAFVKNKEQKQPVIEESIETNDEDFYVEGSAKADSFYEESYEETSIYENIEEYEFAEEKVYTDTIEDNIFRISEYPYRNKTKSKEAMELYNKMKSAKIEEFACVEMNYEDANGEKPEGSVSPDKVYFKRSINVAEYKYYGEFNSNNEPEGMGILIINWDNELLESEKYYTGISYIGEFKNGYLDGYGIEFGTFERGLGSIIGNSLFVKYEGQYKQGHYDGIGSLFEDNNNFGFKEICETIDYQTAINEISNEYESLLEQCPNNSLVFLPIYRANKLYEGNIEKEIYKGSGKLYYENGVLEYEGGFLYGGYNGIGKLYYKNGVLEYEGGFLHGSYNGIGKLYYETGKLKYEGNFKNGRYDGEGTVYDEKGNVLYQGEFLDGDIA